MAYKIGLKLWSINTGVYFQEAKRLYADGFFDYIELYIIPSSIETLSKWRTVNIPFTIHCPHFVHGFNLAQAEKKSSNLIIYEEVKNFADALAADYIIFHGGNRGNIEETARQLINFNESRALIENKPYFTLPRPEGVKRCVGATPEEIQFVKNSAKCGFCLDFGHAVCSANSQGKEPYGYIEEFMRLNPTMFHIAGCEDITSPLDTHLHLSAGHQNPGFYKRILPPTAKVTLETEKDSAKNLNDFIGDVQWMKSL